MVWVTARDEQMLEWLGLVKITSMDGVRWVLGALNGTGGPVSLRQAQAWAARMEKVELVGRGRVSSVGGALVWPTHAASGRTPPALLRQTTRHEVAVSLASARYVAAGWSWDKDQGTATKTIHRADGVAFYGSSTDLVEVELTGKRPMRYREILSAFRWRVAQEGVSSVTYLCTAPAARALNAALATDGGYGLREHTRVVEVFDARGMWVGADQLPWLAVEESAS